VQVKDADGNNILQGDNDPEIVYDGPMAVLVNRLSASASEIFAGAIQDYQRGPILGSQTFGKGTVQELIPMTEGQMKITRAKFYRISGESTQHKGVTPDLSFPDLYSVSEDIGESALPTALPWDTIEPYYYRPYADIKTIMPELNARHENRMTTDPDFIFIREEIDRAIENREKNEFTLNEAKLLSEREENDAWRLAAENRRRAAKGLPLLDDTDELENIDEETGLESAVSSETDEVAQADNAATEKEQDPYLVESGKILLDMIELQSGNAVSLALRQQ
jgi:carboxyl-terminal processing protease